MDETLHEEQNRIRREIADAIGEAQEAQSKLSLLHDEAMALGVDVDNEFPEIENL